MIEIEDIKKATRILKRNKYRPKDQYGKPGGLLDITDKHGEAIVIGDLHGSIENLKKIINHDGNSKKLSNGKRYVVCVGDGMHNDQTGQMREMKSSLKVFEEIIKLICKYKENFIYIRGNHDSFDERLVKSGIKQGLEFKNYILEHRDEEYLNTAEIFFESLPLFVIGNGFIVTHAGPIRGGSNRDELINIIYDPDAYHQLLWNRLHEFRGNPNMREYGEYDIQLMLTALKLPKDTPFIVGHNPMWHSGDKTGIWRDIIGIKNHIIIYSNIGTNAPYLRISEGIIHSEFASQNEEPENIYV